jgi:hypothetical protein
MRLEGWWLGIASITRSILSGSGRARTSTLPTHTSHLAPRTTLRGWWPRIRPEHLELDGAADTGAGHLAEPRRRRWRQHLATVTHPEAAVDLAQATAVEVVECQGPAGQPLLTLVERIDLGPRREGAHQMLPQRIRRRWSTIGDGKGDEARQGLHRGGAGAGLPLVPLLGDPPAAPGVHLRGIGPWAP